MTWVCRQVSREGPERRCMLRRLSDKAKRASLTVCACMVFVVKPPRRQPKLPYYSPLSTRSLRMAANRGAVDHMLPVCSPAASAIEARQSPWRSPMRQLTQAAGDYQNLALLNEPEMLRTILARSCPRQRRRTKVLIPDRSVRHSITKALPRAVAVDPVIPFEPARLRLKPRIHLSAHGILALVAAKASLSAAV